MIALSDDLNHEVDKKKSRIRTIGKMQKLLHKIVGSPEERQRKKTDHIALNQLLQLDDALLKDMGISRAELDAVRNGTLAFDALIKQEITTVRDNASNTQLPGKRT